MANSKKNTAKTIYFAFIIIEDSLHKDKYNTYIESELMNMVSILSIPYLIIFVLVHRLIRMFIKSVQN